jgi:glycosyltransferase involved in cell wall biosynthesis
LTQRGGAERVVLALAEAFPEAPIHTSLYDPAGTFPEFGSLDVRTLPINRSRMLRRHHRLALPVLAPSFSRLRIEADVTICSSSGWAHGAQVTGRKIVYCHAPARWLYQEERYLGQRANAFATAALRLERSYLLRWDQRAAASANLYLANSTVTCERIRSIYGMRAEILAPPNSIDAQAPQDRDPNLEPGFVLCVSRLLPYKNVDAVVDAFRDVPDQRLVVAGVGPEEPQLRRRAPTNFTFVGAVPDARLRWLYASSVALVVASHEDFGLTPLEAAAFGKPTAALRDGGFLDTLVEDETGVFFLRPDRASIAAALARLLERDWNRQAIRMHADRFSQTRFSQRLREIVEEVAA